MTDAASLILDLLTYIEQVEKLKYKPVFTVPTEFFAVYQHELNSEMLDSGPLLRGALSVDSSRVKL
jgi:hypothetical protein